MKISCLCCSLSFAVYFIPFYIQSIHCHNNFPKEIPFFHAHVYELRAAMQNNVTFCPAQLTTNVTDIISLLHWDLYKHLLASTMKIPFFSKEFKNFLVQFTLQSWRVSSLSILLPKMQCRYSLLFMNVYIAIKICYDCITQFSIASVAASKAIKDKIWMRKDFFCSSFFHIPWQCHVKTFLLPKHIFMMPSMY